MSPPSRTPSPAALQAPAATSPARAPSSPAPPAPVPRHRRPEGHGIALPSGSVVGLGLAAAIAAGWPRPASAAAPPTSRRLLGPASLVPSPTLTPCAAFVGLPFGPRADWMTATMTTSRSVGRQLGSVRSARSSSARTKTAN